MGLTDSIDNWWLQIFVHNFFVDDPLLSESRYQPCNSDRGSEDPRHVTNHAAAKQLKQEMVEDGSWFIIFLMLMLMLIIIILTCCQIRALRVGRLSIHRSRVQVWSFILDTWICITKQAVFLKNGHRVIFNSLWKSKH